MYYIERYIMYSYNSLAEPEPVDLELKFEGGSNTGSGSDSPKKFKKLKKYF